MGATASRVTTGALNGANLVISANTIRVESILVASGVNAVDVVMQDADGAALGTISVLAGDSIQWQANAMYDNGLTFIDLTDAAVIVTVSHTADGA